MNTPICDFVRDYAARQTLRLHMPGHKGCGPLGVEALDITEIDRADSLYEATGIIARSEANASALFGASTFYSTEGSSQCIRAMLYLALIYAKKQGRRPVIAAARNVHKTFLSAAALLDLEVQWLSSGVQTSYLSCKVTAQTVEAAFSRGEDRPVAVYLTSPDYLGTMQDIAEIAKVCHQNGALLLVDNAHGAYLRFLPRSLHPMDLGADLCCDSAHKTLPVLTGGAYLHVHPKAPDFMVEQGKNALALFGSTSPSYLILQSLDGANAHLAERYPRQLAAFLPRIRALKEGLQAHGYRLTGEEPLKITLMTKDYGYTGQELAAMLDAKGIVCEFADPDYLVLMLTPDLGQTGLDRLEGALTAIGPRISLRRMPPVFHPCQRVLSLRQAVLSAAETVPVEESIGRILAAPSVGCPPAVPIVICGERIDAEAADCFAYYGIKTCNVVAE